MNAPAEGRPRGVGALVAWIVLASLAVSATAAWLVLRRTAGPAAGAPPATHFDLTDALVPAAAIVASGAVPGQIPPLDDPVALTAAEVAAFDAEHRGKFLVPSDRVAGVVLGGVARAYPLRMLDWHEVINDTVGGVPVAVTRHPLCGSVAVFERRVDGETLAFGASGLLLQSNLLLYDRRGAGEEPSLWSQLQARAIAGPAARRGSVLVRLPVTVARWEHWRRVHPDTTVPRPDPPMLERYERNPYGNYLLTGKLRYPVSPLPPPGALGLMDPVLVIGVGDAERIVPLGAGRFSERALEAAAADAGLRLSLEPEGDEPSIALEAEARTPVTYALWFAWYAQHADRAPERHLTGP